jgi:ABC-2 type transport system ATP-binding protein
MITMQDIWKSYGAIEALQGVSFAIEKGEIVGLLGPNGAGKTTIMKILTGYLHPDEGTVTVDQVDVIAQPRVVQKKIGYLPENAPLYPELTVQSYLGMMADLRQIPDSERRAHISEAIYATSLEDYLTRPIGELSKGLRQRVGIAQAILHRPEILILDEPTIGLDPTQVVEIRKLIRGLARQSTVIFSTHILSEVEATCERAIILINGKVRADAHLSDLASSPDAILVLDQKPTKAISELNNLPGVRSLEEGETPDGYPMYRVVSQGDEGESNLCPAIYQIAKREGWPVRELKREYRTLETIFNDLATSS